MHEERETPAPWDRGASLVLILATVATLLALYRLLWLANYGFDFTDEGFYLNWMSNPSLYNASVTQFGFVYHPIYELLNGNVVLLRQANIALTYLLGWLLCNTLLLSLADVEIVSRQRRWMLAAPLACSSLVFFDPWLPTPNYNSLALQAVLLVVIGLIHADREWSRKSLLGYVLIGLGGCLAFLAKPTTAIVLGPLSLTYLAMARKWHFTLSLVSIVGSVVLLVLFGVAIDGSLGRFVHRLSEGLEITQTIGGGHSLGQLFRLDSFGFRDVGMVAFGTLMLGTWLNLELNRSASRFLRVVGFTLSFLMIVAGVVCIYGVLAISADEGILRRLLALAIPAAGLMFYAFRWCCRDAMQIRVEHWALFAFLILMPYAYAFGTNNNYWDTGSTACIFWALAALPLVVASKKGQASSLISVTVFAVSVQFLSLSLVGASLENPYRQLGSLSTYKHEVEINQGRATLRLSEGYGRYLEEVIRIGNRTGLSSGAPVIDLSGQSPGTIYALGASSIGQPWIIGGYPGSPRFAEHILGKVPCERLAGAWLLFEPRGPRSISAEVLASFGADALFDYEIAGEVETPVGRGGYMETRRQQLLRPVRSLDSAHRACTRIREASGDLP